MEQTKSVGIAHNFDRRLAHKDQNNEFFLTDVDDEARSFNARLPSSHDYYGDGCSALSNFPDMLVLMEACRQAATASAHMFWGVPQGRHFILDSWRAHFPMVRRPRFDGGQVELRLEVSLRKPKQLANCLSGGLTHITVRSADGEASAEIGTMDLNVRYVNNEAYELIRRSSRGGGLPPTSRELQASSPAISARRVGFSRKENVAIGEPSITGQGGRAPLRIPIENLSMFDHDQDHVPGMVLVEAARQLAVITCPEILEGDKQLELLESGFRSFVELDSGAELVLSMQNSPASIASKAVTVAVLQSGRTAAETWLSFGEADTEINLDEGRAS